MMSDDKTPSSTASPPDQGRAGWNQVSSQDELHWSDQQPQERKEDTVPDDEDHGRNENLDHQSRDDDGFSEHQARKDDDTPDSNWELDDTRRTEFAGSRDGTNHPQNPPDIDGQPPLTLSPE